MQKMQVYYNFCTKYIQFDLHKSSSLRIAGVSTIIIIISSRVSSTPHGVSPAPGSLPAPIPVATTPPATLCPSSCARCSSGLVRVGVSCQLSWDQLTQHGRSSPAASWQLGNVSINVKSIVPGTVSIACLNVKW